VPRTEGDRVACNEIGMKFICRNCSQQKETMDPTTMHDARTPSRTHQHLYQINMPSSSIQSSASFFVSAYI